MPASNEIFAPLPPDDRLRDLAIARPNQDQSLPHIGLVGATYTIVVPGEATGGRFTVIDMHVPPGGGPPPHRHSFEETFIVLEGEIEATFRGRKTVIGAGATATVPSNAPHQFKNVSLQPVRMVCICAPAGQERLFLEVGVPVASRTTPSPSLDAQQEAAFMKKVKDLAPRYHTELLEEA